jgi:hypothetical protein
VVELLAHLVVDGRQLAWPVAVIAESRDDLSVVFRSYGSQWPVDGRRHVRPPILQIGVAHPVDVVGCHQSALAAGDTEAILHTFGSDGYYREPTGADYIHHGAPELRAFSRMSSTASDAAATVGGSQPIVDADLGGWEHDGGQD